jgi:hypothetical protein
MGVSGRAMLKAIVAGETDPRVMAALAQGRLCHKRDQLIEALEGRVSPINGLFCPSSCANWISWSKRLPALMRKCSNTVSPSKT